MDIKYVYIYIYYIVSLVSATKTDIEEKWWIHVCNNSNDT